MASGAPTLTLPETFDCEDCGEQYRGFNFFSRHVKEEHGKEADYHTAKKSKPAFTIIAGKPKNEDDDDDQKDDKYRVSFKRFTYV